MTKWLSRKSADGSKWIHPAESLRSGQVVYTVKLFGSVDASGTKGIEVVRDAMQKTKFNRQLLKADGVKCPKVDIIINIENVVIRNTKTKEQMHRFPLQQLSYCADDKAERRLFAFVARDSSTSAHRCFVFDSEKCAEEITLTIGQAFELAYQKFLEEKPAEPAKMAYVTEINELKQENAKLKERITQLENFITTQGHQVPLSTPSKSNGNPNGNEATNSAERLRLDSGGSSNSVEPEIDRTNSLQPNGSEHLLIESLSFTSHTPIQEENGKNGVGIPALPPPTVPARSISRSSSGEGQSFSKLPQAPAVTNGNSLPATAVSPTSTTTSTARPRPQPRLPSLSETNPFKSTDFPPQVTVAPPTTTALATMPAPVNCLMDSSWSASSGHVAALADFDPLSVKTSN